MASQARYAKSTDLQMQLDEVQAELERMICHRLAPGDDPRVTRRYALLLAEEELLLLRRRRERT